MVEGELATPVHSNTSRHALSSLCLDGESGFQSGEVATGGGDDGLQVGGRLALGNVNLQKKSAEYLQ